MNTYKRGHAYLERARSHPWTDAVSSSASRYYDFKAEPQLVRTALEDFTPWNGAEAVDTFYRLLEWLNAPGGTLESNDCEFTGPHDNPTPQFRKALECSGRLMILYRDLSLNLSYPQVESLEGAAHRHLARIDPGFEWGAVGTTIMSTRFLGLPVPAEDQMGYQLMLSFWAWGNAEAETMANLARLFENLSLALRRSSEEIA